MKSGRHWAVLLVVIVSLRGADSLPDALQSKRYPDALMFTDALLARNPNDLKAWTARGIALGGLGRVQESIAAFENALKSTPEYLPALQGAIEVSYGTRDPRAAAFLARLIRVSPQNQIAHAMAGVLAFEANDCAAAIQHFERGMTEIVNNPQAYPLYGACLLTTDRPLEAVKVFKQIVAKSSDSASMRFNLGYAQLLAHHPTDAVNTLKSLTDAPNPSPDVLNLIASAESAVGRWEPAMAHLRKAAGIAPSEERNYVDLAAICLQGSALDAALEVVGIGLKNVPGSARLYSIRGIIGAQRGRLEEAVADFDLANHLDSRQEYGAAGLGILYTEIKRADLAVSVLRERLKQAPKDFMLNYLLAQAIMDEPLEPATPPFEEARQALATSIQVKPDFLKAHTLLGKLYSQVGENEKALRELKLGNQEDRMTLSQLAIVLRRLGRIDEAAEVLVQLKQIIIHGSQAKVALPLSDLHLP